MFKLLMAVTDGPGVRNFLHGRFLNVLKSVNSAITICSGLPLQPLCEASGNRFDGIVLYEMPIYRELRLSHFLRKSAELAHMNYFRTVSMRLNLQLGTPRGISSRAMVNRAAYALANACRHPRRIRRLAQEHERSVLRHSLTTHYRNLLEEAQPDVVFSTHQRPPQSAPLITAAKSLGIPTATFIVSWDNLSSKGRIPISYDHYLVWSEHMRSELLRFYPDVRPDSVHVVGTSQFEPYVYSEFGWTEARFVRELGLQAGLRRICFSCGDQSTSPNDPGYIAALAEANRRGAFREAIEIIIRTSPAEGEERFRSVMAKYPELKWSPPRWVQTRQVHPEPWSQRIPSREDLDLLKSTIHYSDVNVNVASTMTLDYALSGKPTVNVAFSGNGGKPEWHDDSIYYKFDHYRPAVDLSAVRVARSAGELVVEINAYLSDPSRDASGRRRLLEMQLGMPLQNTSERIVETLLAIPSKKSLGVTCLA